MSDEYEKIKAEEKEVESEKGNNWIIASVLVIVGLALLGRNFTNLSFDNWWALFMIIPLGIMVKNVGVDYKRHGRLTNKSTGPLIASLGMLAMMGVFLFNLSLSGLWPLAFIIGGIAVLLGHRS